MSHLLPIAFLLVPFGFLATGVLNKGHRIALIISALVILSTKIKAVPLRIFCWYAAGWCVFRHAYFTFGGVFAIKPDYALTAIIFLIVGMVVYTSTVESELTDGQFYKYICIAAIIQAVVCIAQETGFDFAGFFGEYATNEIKTMVSGTLGNSNFAGGFLAISMFFFMRKKWCWFLFLIVPALLLTRSAGSFIAASVGVAVFYRSRWKIILPVFIAALSAIVWFKGRGMLQNPRFEMWQGMLSLIFSNPLTAIFGHGPGARAGYDVLGHNDVLQFIFYYGIVGLTILGFYIYQIDKTDNVLLTAFCASFANCFSSQLTHMAPSVFLILMILGMMDRKKHGGFYRADACEPEGKVPSKVKAKSVKLR